MAEHKFTMDEIKQLMEMFSGSELTDFQLTEEDFSIHFEKGKAVPVPVYGEPQVSAPTLVQGAGAVSQVIENTTAQEIIDEVVDENSFILKAPIIGTFYSASSPDKEAFAAVDTEVSVGDTLCIIESMKLMNEVTSEVAGTVLEVFVKDGDPLEYGQPIMKISIA